MALCLSSKFRRRRRRRTRRRERVRDGKQLGTWRDGCAWC